MLSNEGVNLWKEDEVSAHTDVSKEFDTSSFLSELA